MRIRQPVPFNKIVLIFLLILLSIGISFGFTSICKVVNNTNHYLHVFINGNPFLYVEPGKSVSTELKTENVTVKAVYSPGQAISGEYQVSYNARPVDESGCDCALDSDPSRTIYINPADM